MYTEYCANAAYYFLKIVLKIVCKVQNCYYVMEYSTSGTLYLFYVLCECISIFLPVKRETSGAVFTKHFFRTTKRSPK